MNDEKQKINTILIPETGLNLEPPYTKQANVTIDFSRVFAHVVGKGPNSGILIRSTTDGSLIVSSAGVPFEIYVVNDGTSLDPFSALHTFEFALAYNVTDFLIETFPSVISFRNLAGNWLPEKILPVGMHSIDFINYGIRIRNRIPGSDCDYEITSYR